MTTRGGRTNRSGEFRPGLTLVDPRRRITAVGIFVAMALSLFAGRLVQLQGLEASAYAETASAERLQTVDIPATRGEITDVHGVPLATTVDAVNITADQTQVGDPLSVAAALAPVVGVDMDILRDHLTGESNGANVLDEVTPAVWHKVEELRLPGIYGEPTAKRVYPQGSLAANLLGFVGSEGHGLGGFEASLDRTLAGKDGQLTFEAAPGGSRIPTGDTGGEEATPGVDVRLTIDRDLQFMAERAIRSKVNESQAESGTVVVMDPRTGRVLALATYPSFDPGNYLASSPENRGNRAVSDIYEPGSTSKVMTMAAALDAGVVSPSSRIEVPPILYRGGSAFHDHDPHGTLHLTATGVLAQSSNLGMMLIAEELGREKLYDSLKLFGIGEPSGLGFPGESPGILPAVNDWGPTNFATIAFGQGLSLNAVQSTSVFATIANDGVRVEPTLVDGTTTPDGNYTPAPAPVQHRVVSTEAATTLREMMETVVSDEGTAPMAQIPGYRVAGKTGTAERVVESCGCYQGYTASFIGFAPADDPALVVSVTLQDPVNGHYGGELGGPVFKRVMSFALQTQQIPPTKYDPPHLRLTYRP